MTTSWQQVYCKKFHAYYKAVHVYAATAWGFVSGTASGGKGICQEHTFSHIALTTKGQIKVEAEPKMWAQNINPHQVLPQITIQWWVVWYWDYRDGRQISTTPTTDSMTLNVTSSGLGVVLKFLKFWNLSWNVLKLVRSWNLYIYPEIFTRFHIFFKNTSFFLFYLWVSNTGHKESSVVPDFSIKMACRGHSRSIILRSLESR